ncbi:hypothetical protein RDWZM_003610 [Blomia tropicalis]|uniref:Exportin-4 n=1 Tax=Blomia tropicalis TaxID=40697 RepID=A0A9Q0MJT9_BLOTA|nr:hypothetical protein RDWZM_003610 [Blomia tropicalis]
MSTAELLQQLETCAQIIMAPPDKVTMNDRNRAQDVFLNFQQKNNPFDLCRELMEMTSNQVVLFQVGSCLKHGVIRDWDLLKLEQGKALFTFLFEYTNQRQLEQYVIEEFMLVSAIILKRIQLGDSQKEMDKMLIEQLCDLIKNQSSPLTIRLNACSAISLIIAEFCTINQNSDYGISWFSHLAAQRHFEKFQLKNIFQSIVSALFDHMKLSDNDKRTNEWVKLSTKLIRICEAILSWNFNFLLESCTILALTYARNRDRIESMVFQPHSDWVQLIFDGNLISFFFEVYLSFRSLENSTLVHHALQCLNQLSTMTGPIFLQRDVRKKFCEIFISNIVNLINMIFDIVTIHELVFLANFINSICNRLRSDSLQYCDVSLLKNFWEIMSKLTCKVLVESVQISDEENMVKCNQTIDFLVNSWMVVINGIQYTYEFHDKKPIENFDMSQFITIEQLTTLTRPIFENYIRAHLYQPEGLVPLTTSFDDEEVHELEEDDSTLYREQLNAIGVIAQFDAAHSVNTLTQLLIMKLRSFESCIMENGSIEEKTKRWSYISEDIHWILMISMHSLTLCTENEIPSSIMKLSIASTADVMVTQNALQTMDITQESIDPVVRFMIVIFKFINMEKCLLERQMVQWVSPQVSHTLALFISRFMQIYLILPEYEADFVEMSLSLNTCFGVDSPSAKQLINFLLDYLLVKFSSMASEVKLLELSSAGLLTFCKYKDRIKVMQQSSSLMNLLEKFTRNELPNLNVNVRRNMYNIFVIVFNNNLDIVIDPLMVAYQKFYIELNAGNKELVREHFMQTVECTQGIAFGLTNKTFSTVWNKFLSHVYNDLPRVMSLMHNFSSVVQAILELMFTFSVTFCCFFKESESIAFYNTAVNILTEYATRNKEKYSLDSARGEELQNEFIWILKFLNDLSNQDIFYFFTNPSASSSLSTTIGKVVLTSLNIIIPLMSNELLENATLCTLYYKLLEFIAQDSERFKGFPFKLFESFLKCVDYAFKSPNISTEIKTISFKIIIELGLQAANEPEKNQEVVKSLLPFLRSIFEFIFCELVKSHNDHNLRDIVSLALYTLLCCYKDTYREHLRDVLRMVGNVEAEQAIHSSLTEIVEQVGINCKINQNRLAFQKRFAEFINKLHSMLSLR